MFRQLMHQFAAPITNYQQKPDPATGTYAWLMLVFIYLHQVSARHSSWDGKGRTGFMSRTLLDHIHLHCPIRTSSQVFNAPVTLWFMSACFLVFAVSDRTGWIINCHTLSSRFQKSP